MLWVLKAAVQYIVFKFIACILCCKCQNIHVLILNVIVDQQGATGVQLVVWTRKIAGIDIVDDEDMEEELAQTEEDREVENLLKSNRQKHDRLQKGTAY